MKKNKKVKAQNAVIETATPVDEATVVETPVYAVPVTEKKYEVSCPRCSAKLNIKDNSVAYMCPVCNNLFRAYVGTKMVKDVSRKIVSEAYINVTKGADEK